MLVALALRTVDRNTAWASNADLFFTDVKTYPQGAHLNKAAGGELLRWTARITDEYERGRVLTLAERFLIQALRIYPRYPQALRDRGRVRAMLGDMDGAESFFESALQLAPHDAASKEYLAKLRGQAEAKESRLAELLSRIEERPDEPELRVEAGQLLIELARPHKALEHLERAAELAPDDIAALRLLAQVYIMHFENERAAAVYRQVLELDPDDWEAHVNLPRLLAADDSPAALRHALRAHRLRPGDLSSNVNLAEAYAANEQYEQALQRYYLVLRGFPENHPFRAALHDRITELERLAR
jgi:tetratricopeptide (TPR) repeat protein